MTLCSVPQSRDAKRFKEKLREEEKLALKNAELQAPKDKRKQHMNEVKTQCSAKKTKKVRSEYSEENKN